MRDNMFSNFVTISGGEPFMYRDSLRFFKHHHQEKYRHLPEGRDLCKYVRVAVRQLYVDVSNDAHRKSQGYLPLIINSAQRVELYRKWEHLFEHKKYCIADFWNSGCVLDGCIAYGRWNGYFYIDWDGKIMHGSIRDHFENFKSNILSKGATPENLEAFQMLEDPDIEAFLVRFEKDLQQLTEKIWIEEYCREEEALLTG